MSLIDEALKRARMEAARQDAAKRRSGVPWVPVATPARRGRPWAVWAVAGVLLAGLGVGAGFFLAGREMSPTDTERAAVEAAPPDVPVVTPGGAAEPLVTVEEEGGLPAPAEQPSPGTPIRDRPVEATVPELRTAPPPAAVPQPAEPPASVAVEAPPAPPPGQEAPPPAEPAVEPAPAPQAAVPLPREEPAPAGPAYLREAVLPGGEKLVLTGIAYSAQPIAVINGTVVGPGEVVEGFTIVRIQPDRVELRGDAGSMVLLLRPGQ